VPPIVLDRESYQQLAVSGPPAGRAGAVATDKLWTQRLAHMPMPVVEASIVDRLLARFDARLRAAPWTEELLGQSTEVSRGFGELLAAVRLPPASPAPHDPVLREMLVRMHFVRETEVLGGPKRALALMLLGHHLAARLCGPHAERLVSWFWLLTTEGSHRLVLDPGEERQIVPSA
jgi:hypothetical protein